MVATTKRVMEHEMANQTKYNINLDVAYEPLQRIDLQEIVKTTTDKWFNQTLTKVNDSVVRIGILEGEFHWHKHDNEDEFFFVVDGELLIDLEGETVELKPQQGFMVPMGVMHRTRAPKKTVVLMVEAATVQPVGDD
jgi:mannose-6-phosphate isomerase-like protein (cupin superfamily)